MRDDRDPPWTNDHIKIKHKGKNSMYKNYEKWQRNEDFELLTKAVAEVS